MGIKAYRPTTPTRRFQTTLTREELTASRPEKSLTQPLKSTGGRNNKGHITSRYMSGGLDEDRVGEAVWQPAPFDDVPQVGRQFADVQRSGGLHGAAVRLGDEDHVPHNPPVMSKPIRVLVTRTGR